jgi:O-acetyl-ADP-ribose deacetylase (regulator of RNase III)
VAEAAKVALGTIMLFLQQSITSIKEIVFVLFDPKTYKTYSSTLEEILHET